MSVATYSPSGQSPKAHVAKTEIRGAVARLFRYAKGEIIISGPAGTGKTRQILEWLHDQCNHRRVNVLILRKTLESLKASALVTYQSQVLHEFDGKRSALDRVEYFGGNSIRPAQFTYLRTGSMIVPGGMDNLSKVLSTEWDIIYVNEAIEFTAEEWEQLSSRTDRPTLDENKPASLLLGDTNPGSAKHWILKRRKQGHLKLWNTTHRDNPAMWDREAQTWTKAGLRYLKRLNKLTGVRRKRLLIGAWVSAEGVVYDFNPDVHIVTVSPFGPDRPAHGAGAGVDWGWTKPGALLVGQWDGDKNASIVHEVYQTRRTIDWWIEQAKWARDRYDIAWFACDPSEPAYIDQFVSAGLNAFPANNAILPGIGAVEQRLKIVDGRSRLTFVAGCNAHPDEALVEEELPASTVDEMDIYIWDMRVTKGVRNREKPIDDNNHGLDALRYFVMGLDAGPVSDWAYTSPDDLTRVFGRSR
jgi:phage terminase large subunit